MVLGLYGRDSRKASKQFSDLYAGDGEVTDAFSEEVCHCTSYMEGDVVSIDKICDVNRVTIAGNEEFAFGDRNAVDQRGKPLRRVVITGYGVQKKVT